MDTSVGVNTMKKIIQIVLKIETFLNFRALHGKFTAVVYRGKAYHGYTVVASYHVPYR